MKLFNVKYVHVRPDKRLIGRPAYLHSSVDYIEELVNSGAPGEVVVKVGYSEKPFLGSITKDWQPICYYDPHLPYKKAFLASEDVFMLDTNNEGEQWQRLVDWPDWDKPGCLFTTTDPRQPVYM